MTALTIPDEDAFAVFNVVASQSVFPISFSLFAKADLRIEVVGTNRVDLLQSDFTFAGNVVDGGFDGGTVTLVVPVANVRVIIWRQVEPVRTTNFAPALFVRIPDIDSQFNALEAQIQDARRDLGRALLVEVGEAGFNLGRAADRADTFLAFDDQGAPIFVGLPTFPSPSLAILAVSATLAIGAGYYCDSSGGALAHTMPALAVCHDGQAIDLWGGQTADVYSVTVNAAGSDTFLVNGVSSTSIQITTNDVAVKLMRRAGAWQVLRINP